MIGIVFCRQWPTCNYRFENVFREGISKSLSPKNMALPMKVLFASIATGLLVWGIYDCITNFEQNGCEMTWMFEYPKYLVGSIPNLKLSVTFLHVFPLASFMLLILSQLSD